MFEGWVIEGGRHGNLVKQADDVTEELEVEAEVVEGVAVCDVSKEVIMVS
jgi:hypothetical protein